MDEKKRQPETFKTVQSSIFFTGIVVRTAPTPYVIDI